MINLITILMLTSGCLCVNNKDQLNNLNSDTPHGNSSSSIESGSNTERKKRIFNLFPVVKFPNSNCKTDMGGIGTCYEESQCKTKGGIPEGRCASGFGVCCKFNVPCGGTSKENVSYLLTDTTSSDCRYEICKRSSDISLLRLDFDEFDISPPFTCGGSSTSVVCGGSEGPLIGDCIYDTFVVTTPGYVAPPVICGYNTGQHMYVPASDNCNIVAFNFDFQVNLPRVWRIKVSQIHSSYHNAPPPGCLQYYTGITGTVENFNFKNRKTSYHLSSQRYSVCWRRERGYCKFCVTQNNNLAFGLSNVPSKVPASGSSSWNKKAGFTDSICCSEDSTTANCKTSGANDFIEIDNAYEHPSPNSPFDRIHANRFCGRFLTAGSGTVQFGVTRKTVCTLALPFRMRVDFSDGEVISSSSTCSTSTRTGDTTDECSSFPRIYGERATIGFSLDWFQEAC